MTDKGYGPSPIEGALKWLVFVDGLRCNKNATPSP